MLSFEERTKLLQEELAKTTPEELLAELESYKAAGVTVEEFLNKKNSLKINSLMQVICIDTEVVYGSLFRAEDESIYFRKSWYIEDLADCEQKQIDKILEEINRA